MFIKILTPNHNGKIELTARDLEALIQEAVDKAIAEDRANRPYNTWYGGTTLLNGKVNETGSPSNIDGTKVTCTGNKNITLLSQNNNNQVANGITFTDAINDIIGE
jgi:hypothetical protein